MTDEGSEPKDIVRAGQQGLSPQERQDREPMNLEKARSVLTTVVNTHESTFTKGSDLSRVGGVDIEQVKEALLLVAQDVMQTTQGRKVGSGIVRTEKQTSRGVVELLVYHQLDEEGRAGEPENLYMSLVKDGNFVLESEVPLRESESWVRQEAVRFSDFRRGENVTSMYELKKNFTIDKFRHIWRGMRWLSANMLDWSGELKLPEDIDRLSLSPSRTKALPA